MGGHLSDIGASSCRGPLAALDLKEAQERRVASDDAPIPQHNILFDSMRICNGV